MRLWRYELAGCKNFVCKLKITSVPITLTLPYYSRIIYVIKLSSIHSGKHTTFETSKARLLSNRCIFLKKISNEHRYGYGRINQSQLYVTKSHQISIHISPMLCWDKTVIKTFLHKKTTERQKTCDCKVARQVIGHAPPTFHDTVSNMFVSTRR